MTPSFVATHTIIAEKTPPTVDAVDMRRMLAAAERFGMEPIRRPQWIIRKREAKGTRMFGNNRLYVAYGSDGQATATHLLAGLTQWEAEGVLPTEDRTFEDIAMEIVEFPDFPSMNNGPRGRQKKTS